MSELTCGSCSHYVQHPPDPANLTAERRGECRHSPPSLTVLPGPQGAMQLVGYPVMPPQYPACHQHSAPTAPTEDDGLRGWQNVTNVARPAESH